MNKTLVAILFLVFPVILFPYEYVEGAMTSYLTLEGETIGPIHGECTQSGRENTILVYSFGHNIHFPYDPATGQPRRRHFPQYFGSKHSQLWSTVKNFEHDTA